MICHVINLEMKIANLGLFQPGLAVSGNLILREREKELKVRALEQQSLLGPFSIGERRFKYVGISGEY